MKWDPMPQVKSGYDGAGGDYIKWMCGAAGGRPGGAMANLQRGVGSIVRDIGDPCLNPSPVKVAIGLYSKSLLLFNTALDCLIGIDTPCRCQCECICCSLVSDIG